MKNLDFLIYRAVLSLIIGLGAGTLPLHAQPGSPDTNFNAAEINGQIGFSLAVQPDGKVIAVGTFGVMRFLDNGAVDPAFQAIPSAASEWNPGNNIGALVLQPDGRIVVTGNFTNAAGVQLPGIFRLNSDGSIDPSFNLGPNIFPAGRVLALQPDGKIVSTAVYYGPGSSEDLRSGLLRLNPDGSQDTAFNIAEWNDPSTFYSLAITPEGQIYSGHFGSLLRNNPDGSRDDSFNIEEPGLGPIAALAIQPDGRLIVGQYGDGPGFKSIRRLLPDGTDDPEWTVPAVNGGDAVVYALLLQPDGKVLAGGNNLEAFNGVPNAHLGRLNPDGSVDTTFDTRGDLHYYSVEDMAFAPDGKIVVTGHQLNRPDITAAPGVWRLDNDIVPRGIEFAAANYIAREGDGWVSIPVRRTTDTDKLAVVAHTARPGTATRWRDYFGGDGVLVFRPGEILKNIRLYVVGDHKPENYETVRLTLVRARGGSIGPQRQATLTILDK